MALKTGVMADENSALHHRNIFQSIVKQKTNILNCDNISQYYCFFSVFLIKSRLDEHK